MKLKLLSLFIASALAEWTIPEGQPNGVYSVSVDEAGVANHTLIAPPAVAPIVERAIIPRPRDTVTRRCTGTCVDYGCGGYQLDPTDTNNAARALDAQCRYPYKGPDLGKDFYSISGGTVWYFCNLASGIVNCVDEDRASYVDKIAGHCGSF